MEKRMAAPSWKNFRFTAPWIAAAATLFLLWTVYSFNLNPFHKNQPPAPINAVEKEEWTGYEGIHTKLTYTRTEELAKEEQVPTPLPTPTIKAPVPAKTTGSAWPDHPFDPLPEDSQRPLIVYVFFETEFSLRNFKFFLAHGLHGAADFLFVINGDSKQDKLIPEGPNIRIHRRDNKCFDLGAFAEVLQINDFYKGYQRYILMNGSIRGPFLPHWADGCWSDMYLNKLTDEVKLVGMTLNCDPQLHVQSMMWALDRTGLTTLLWPNAWTIENFRAVTPGPEKPLDPFLPIPYLETPGINSCPPGYWEAVAIETNAALLLVAAGYKFDVMMTGYQAKKGQEDWQTQCRANSDMTQPKHYYGGTVDPFELLFMKTSRHSPELDADIERLSTWVNEMKYSSFDHCKA